MGKEFGSFRKATFGGFNRKDVIDYIEKMRNESFEYRKQVDETVKSLNKKIIELENAARLVESSAAAEAEPVSVEAPAENQEDIAMATKQLKTVVDELCRSLGDFMERLSEKGVFESAAEDVSGEDLSAYRIYDELDDEPDVPLSFVDGVLSSISFLDASAEDEEKAEDEKAAESKSITDLLSNVGFAE